MFNHTIVTWSELAFQPWNTAIACATGTYGQPMNRGRFISGFYHAGMRNLRYKLFIPSSYRGQPMPLIMMLHGCGQDADDFARGTGMNELAEQAQCLVVYPEQSSTANWNHCWNWYKTANHQRGLGEPALLAGLTGQLMQDYAIDAARISVAGLSSGGAMAVILGRTYPDLFSAVGCHSGLAHGSATDSTGALSVMRDGAGVQALAGANVHMGVPVIVFQGDGDATVHQKNSNEVVRQSIDSYAAFTPGQADDMAMVEETGATGGRTFTRSIHRATSGAVVAEHWMVHGAGHAWSGGNLRGSYTDKRGPNASREMLRFFVDNERAAPTGPDSLAITIQKQKITQATTQAA